MPFSQKKLLINMSETFRTNLFATPFLIFDLVDHKELIIRNLV
jgi:hypothetical protein